MAEYIEREAAIKLVEEDKVEITPTLLAVVGTYTAEQAFDGINQTCDRHIEAIKELPAADVVPVVHGQWVKTVGENGVTSACRCSECGFEDNRYSLFNYCPNCGARMDGGNNG